MKDKKDINLYHMLKYCSSNNNHLSSHNNKHLNLRFKIKPNWFNKTLNVKKIFNKHGQLHWVAEVGQDNPT